MNGGRLNLNQLRFVLAVAATGSFTAGAQRCYVSQPALSSGIAQLERELGERLFQRTTRSVRLTPFGEQLLPLVEQVLGAEADLVRAAEAYQSPEAKQVRIGVCPLVDLARVESVMAGYREANRAVQVVFAQLGGIDPCAALADRRFDFLVGPSEVRHPTMARSLLYEDPLVYFAAGQAAGGDGSAVELRDVAGDTFILVNERCGLSIRTRQLFRTRRLALNEYETRAVSYASLEEWSRLGLGSAILPQSKASAAGAGRPIVLGPGRAATLRFEVVWVDGNFGEPRLQALAHRFRQAAARHA